MEGSASSSMPRACEPCTAYLEENSQDKDKTLCFASASGHIACVKALVEVGANVNSCSWECGDTALTCATKKGNVEMIRCLIEVGADVNYLNKDGDVALQYAAEAGFEECIKLLLEEGADVNRSVPCMKVFMPGLTESECHGKLGITIEGAENDLDSRGNTALMSAAAAGKDKCVGILLKSGADVNHYDQYGETALVYAAMKGSDSCIKLLLKAGVEISPDEGDVMWHYSMTSAEKARSRMMGFALFAAGEKPWGVSDEGHFFGYPSIANYLEDLGKKLILKNVCREIIRNHLLQMSAVNLFVRVPKLGLPAAVERYLLHDVSLDDDLETVRNQLSRLGIV